MNNKIKIVLLALVVLVNLALGQSLEKHIEDWQQLWFGYFSQTRLSNKFGFWTDLHYRTTGNFVDRHFQFLVRPALTYFIRDNLRVNVGYAFVSHFPGRNLTTTRYEHRPWQQNLVESKIQY